MLSYLWPVFGNALQNIILQMPSQLQTSRALRLWHNPSRALQGSPQFLEIHHV